MSDCIPLYRQSRSTVELDSVKRRELVYADERIYGQAVAHGILLGGEFLFFASISRL
jgi:hypothetical protein